MSFFSYALGCDRPDPGPAAPGQGPSRCRGCSSPRLPVVLGVIGLFELFSYAGDHHVSLDAPGSGCSARWLVGAVGLGALRGLSMRVWATNGWVVRQGTAVTMALWLVSLVVHFVGDARADHAGRGRARGRELPPLPRADPRRAVLRGVPPRPAAVGSSSGPTPAGRCRCNFTQGPGAFFATFRRRRPAARAGRGAAGRRPARGTRRSQRDRRRGRGGRRPRATRAARRRADRSYTRRP